MNEYLIPANAKKSKLIAGIFRLLPDLLIFGIGIGVTLLLLLILDNNKFINLILACLPALLCTALVAPIPNYHNTLVALQSIFRFYNERRSYKWKGWCPKDESK